MLRRCTTRRDPRSCSATRARAPTTWPVYAAPTLAPYRPATGPAASAWNARAAPSANSPTWRRSATTPSKSAAQALNSLLPDCGPAFGAVRQSSLILQQVSNEAIDICVSRSTFMCHLLRPGRPCGSAQRRLQSVAHICWISAIHLAVGGCAHGNIWAGDTLFEPQ